MKLSKKLVVFGVTLLFSMPLLGGSLDSPALPSDDSGRMYTLEDIYNRLDTGAKAATPSGGFTEPTSGPTATGKTLTEVYNKADAVMDSISGCIPDSNASPVFTDNGDGTVTDNRSCLMWLKDAGCVGQQAWADVDTSAKIVNLINSGSCDSYTATFSDWRLPLLTELIGLLTDENSIYMVLPSSSFSSIQTDRHWSSTVSVMGTSNAWCVRLEYHGALTNVLKTLSYYVWPVRGGQ